MILKLLLFSIFTLFASCSPPGDKAIISPPEDTISPPTDLNATLWANNQILLTWLDNSDSEKSYEVQRCENSSDWQTITSMDSNTTEYLTSKIQDHIIYSYRVRALSTDDSSDFSNTAYASVKMAYVEGGEFEMGDTFGEGFGREKPPHTIRVKSFFIFRTEVPQIELDEFNPATFKSDSLPAVMLTWYEVINFCNRKSITEGLIPCYSDKGDEVSCNFNNNGYRLPTEAEWEYAARGGNKSEGYRFSGSNDIDEAAWYLENSGRKVHPVGQKIPNELGLYDMNGNVYEWCWDYFDEFYYTDSPADNPAGPKTGVYRVIRGGSAFTKLEFTRITYRNDYLPHFSSGDFGFRLVRSF